MQNLTRARFIGTVLEHRKLSKNMQRIVKPVPDDDSEIYKLEKAIIIGNLMYFNNLMPVQGISCAYAYAESKEVDRNIATLFVGNQVAFDATIEFDNKVGLYRLGRINNFCGRKVPYYNMINEDGTLNNSATFLDFCTKQHCLGCKHWNNNKECVKTTCEENRLYVF